MATHNIKTPAHTPMVCAGAFFNDSSFTRLLAASERPDIGRYRGDLLIRECCTAHCRHRRRMRLRSRDTGLYDVLNFLVCAADVKPLTVGQVRRERRALRIG